MARFEIPKHVGHFEVAPGCFLGCQYRPGWLHRLMLRSLLGWKWRDA